MTNELEVNTKNIPISTSALVRSVDSMSEMCNPVTNELSKTTSCQYCCCRFPTFVGSMFKSSSEDSLNSEDFEDTEYKPYFELETEEEKLSYEYFKLLARVTYDEGVERHREQALEELHQYRLSLLLEELRLIEESDLYSSSDECFSEFRIRIPEKRRSLRIKNKKRLFQKHMRK